MTNSLLLCLWQGERRERERMLPEESLTTDFDMITLSDMNAFFTVWENQYMNIPNLHSSILSNQHANVRWAGWQRQLTHKTVYLFGTSPMSGFQLMVAFKLNGTFGNRLHSGSTAKWCRGSEGMDWTNSKGGAKMWDFYFLYKIYAFKHFPWPILFLFFSEIHTFSGISMTIGKLLYNIQSIALYPCSLSVSPAASARAGSPTASCWQLSSSSSSSSSSPKSLSSLAAVPYWPSVAASAALVESWKY